MSKLRVPIGCLTSTLLWKRAIGLLSVETSLAVSQQIALAKDELKRNLYQRRAYKSGDSGVEDENGLKMSGL